MTRRLYTNDNIGNAVLPYSANQLIASTAFGAGQTAKTLVETADGLTTGLMADPDSIYQITPATASSYITVPTPTAATQGKRIQLTLLGATAVRLKGITGATVTINNVSVGAAAYATLVAANIYYLTQVTATGWLLEGRTNLGAVATPIVPA